MKQRNSLTPSCWDVIIIGSGASGMIAAICAARAGCSVLILEHMNSSGKKILATGNGKCNYTNLNQDISFYRGECPDFVLPVLNQFSEQDVIRFFSEMGIFPKEKNGYLYPYSEQAASVLEAFLIELKEWNVSILYNVAIRDIKKNASDFQIETKIENYFSKTCILATGGKAAKKTGSDGSGYIYAKKLGHTMIEPVPALVQLISTEVFFQQIAGIRIQAKVILYIQNVQVASDTGEVQLTDYGISGIPVFQVSRFASKAFLEKKSSKIKLDFLPQFSLDEVFSLLKKRFLMKGRTALETGIGLFPAKLYPVLLEKASIKATLHSNSCKDGVIQKLAFVIKNFEFTVNNTKSFDSAQVTAGGISTKEIDNQTLESDRVEGLFFAGEIIDIDGACGGYNLQWAWSSGWLSGNSAAQRALEKGKQND